MSHSSRPAGRKRPPNVCLVKAIRTYTVEEAAALLGMHRNTVRRWIQGGLQTVDEQRPTLILGSHLIAYLTARRKQRKQPCAPGEIYCLRCRSPQSPAGGIADCEPQTAALGNLIGICPACDGLIYRRVNLARLDEVRGDLVVSFTKPVARLSEPSQPTLNGDFGQGA